MTNKKYFLLVFTKNNTMPNIISADIIAMINPDTDTKIMDIVTTDDDCIGFEDVESFKMVPVEEINFNI